MDFKRTVSVNQGLDLSSEESRSTLYVMLSELGACNMRPIGSKVISEFHRFKDEIVSKLASQNGIISVPHLLVVLPERVFEPPFRLMTISPTSTSEGPKYSLWGGNNIIVVSIFGVVAISDCRFHQD